MLPKNSKKSVISTIVLTIAMAMSCLNAQDSHAQNAMSREHQHAKKELTEGKLRMQLSFLCDSLCHGRGFATQGGSEAAFWIIREFERIGLLKMGPSFGMKAYGGKGLIGHNIVAMLPGSKYFTRDHYVIVGAHYDHLGELGGNMYPGADANASGTVALINLAQMFKRLRDYGKSHNYNIIFVAFDGKEHDMAGSKAFWTMIENGSITDPQTGKVITSDKIAFMANIDQIGSTLSPLKSGRKDYMIMLGTESLKSNKRDVLETCNRIYGIDMDIDLSYYGSKDFTRIFYRLSDQKVFVEHGIPAVLFTSGITMNTNKRWDTPETLDMDILKKRIFLMYHWIEKMIQ